MKYTLREKALLWWNDFGYVNRCDYAWKYFNKPEPISIDEIVVIYKSVRNNEKKKVFPVIIIMTDEKSFEWGNGMYMILHTIKGRHYIVRLENGIAEIDDRNNYHDILNIPVDSPSIKETNLRYHEKSTIISKTRKKKSKYRRSIKTEVSS